MKIISLCVLLVLGGCSTFSNTYNCGLIPRAGCTPVSRVYEQTSDDVEDYRESTGSSTVDTRQTVHVSATPTSMDTVHAGDPLLSKPKVMRVLYKGFQNEEGDLDTGGFVYLKMKESSWLVDP